MSCTPPTVVVGGVTISTSDFVNSKELLNIGNDQSDPTADEYEGNIANGNNTTGTSGIQIPPPVQTTLPPPIPQPAEESNNTAPPATSPAGVTCTIWDGIDYDAVMSTNFILRTLTVGHNPSSLNQTLGPLFPHQLTDYDATYTKQVRFCNLQALCQRVLEPLWSKFGPFRINSAIRNSNSVSSGISQHVKGQAVDIQFPGWTYARYWENAQWVKDNIPYDQFIFEHSSKTGLAWYHLSFNQAGNRAPTEPRKVMTMYRNNYSPGLHRYG